MYLLKYTKKTGRTSNNNKEIRPVSVMGGVDTLDAAPPMYKTKQGQRSYRTPDFLNGFQAYTRFLLPLWNINKNADCIAIGIFVMVR